MSNDVTEGFIVQVATNIDWGELHQGINFFLVEAGGLAGQGVEEDTVGDLALAGWIEDLES